MKLTPDKTTTGITSTDLPDSLQDIFAHAFECVARVDYQGCYLSVNEAYAKVCGYTQEEMIGMIWRDTVHADDREIVEQKLSGMLDTGRSEVEIRGVRKDKTVFYKELVMVRGLESDTSSVHHYCFINDITDRLLDELSVLKSVKSGLELQEQQFYSLTNNIPGVVFRADVNGCWLFYYLTEGIEKLLGIPPHQLLINGSTNYSSLIHVDDRDRVKQIIESANSENRSYTVEYRIKRADGETRWFEEHANARNNEAGATNWRGGIIRDISDLKKSDRQLNIAQTLIDNSDDALFWLDREGKFIYANNSACKLLGYEREELFELDLFDIDNNFTPEYRQAFLNTVSNFPSSSIKFESIISTKNNRQCDVEITTSVVDSNGEIYTCALVREIAPEKFIEHSHHIEEAILRQLAMNSGQQQLLDSLCLQIDEIVTQTRSLILLRDNSGDFFDQNEASHNPDIINLLRDRSLDVCPGVNNEDDKMVVVEDITTSPAWENHRQIADQHRVKSVWYIPFYSRSGQLSGMLVLLKDSTGTPSGSESDFLYKAGSLVRLVIETCETREQVLGFEKIIESADDMIMYVDTNYRFLGVSNKYAKSHGMTRAEITGRLYREITGDELFYSAIKPRVDRSLAGEHIEFKEWINQPGIGMRYYHLNIDPVRGDVQIIGVIIIMRDITQLFNVSKDLRETRDRYKSIVENSPDIIMVTRMIDGKILSVNRAFEHILGYPVEGVIGKNSAVFYANPDDRNALVRELGQYGKFSGFETIIKAHDGSTIPVLCSANLIEYEGEQCVFSLIRNISKRKEAAAKLNEQNRAILLLQKITAAANEASSIEYALQVCLDEVCIYCDWPVGHAYMLNTASRLLESSGVWHLDSDGDFAVLKRLTELTTFDENTGLPGSILANKKPLWIEDISKSTNLVRADAGEQLNVTSAFGFPVLVGDKVVAVLEFFNHRAVTRDDNLLEVMTSIGVQLGRIMERKQAELALQQSQINFSKAINSCPDSVVITRLDNGKILDVNDAVVEATGYNRAELLENGNGGMFWISQKKCLDHVRNLKKKGRIANDSMFVKCKDDTKIPCLISSTLVDVDGVRCAFSILKNISNLTIAEEQIRESEQEVRVIKDSTAVCISYVDSELRYRSNNMQFEQELGIDNESIAGKSILEVIGAKNYKEIEPYLAAALMGDDVRFEFTFTDIRADQSTYEIIYHPDTRDGIVKGIYITSSNITRRKQTELALIKTNRALRVLSECNNALVKKHNEDELLQAVCELVVRSGGYHMAWTGYVGMEKGEAIHAVACATQDQDKSGKMLAGENSQLDKHLAEEVLTTGKPHVVRNTNDMGDNIKWRNEVLNRDHLSALGLPLNSGKTTIGVLVIASTEAEAFDEEEINLLSSMAENLGHGIQSIRETDKRHKAENILELENHAFQMLASFPDLSHFLHDLVRMVEANLRGQLCSILLLDENSSCLYNGASPNMDMAYIDAVSGCEPGVNADPCARAVFLKQRITIEDIFTDPDWKDFRRLTQKFQLRSCCVTPITATDERVLGTFTAYSTVPGSPDPYELRIIDRMTYIIGRAIERYRTAQALEKNEERLALAMQGSQDGLWDLNLETNEAYWSPRWKSMLGYTEDELEPSLQNFLKLLHPDDRGVHDKIIDVAKDNFEIEFRMRHKDGHYVDILSRSTGLRATAGGKVTRLVGTHIDLTERKRAAIRITESESRFRKLYDDSPSMFFTLDEQGVILSINKYGADHLGFSVGTLIGKPILEITHIDDAAILKQKLKTCISRPNTVQRCEIRKIHKFGDAIWVRANMRSINSETDQKHVLVTCEDISEARILSEQLEYQARHDALTGLINRVEFEKRLRRVLSATSDEADHALCYLDLDQFKIINDTCGHLAGDELLRRVSDVLNTVVRKRDTLARMGGDEFAVLLEHCPIEQAKRVAGELLRCIESLRFVWGGKRFTLGVSIGLVPMRGHGGSLTDILGAADEACYAAKDAGRNRIHVYYSDDVELSRRRGEMEWVTKINQALEEERFCLETQAIMLLDKQAGPQRRNHYELLLRMRTDDGKMIYPGTFLPAAERYNLSEKIDRWVVSTALKWLECDQEELETLAVCSINLSGHSIGDDSFLEFLLAQFERSIVPPQKICFEITETAAIANLGAAILFIHALKEIGCLFALDDFGSGLSSFNYLKNLPVDFLKIDGSFIREIHKDRIDLAMVRSINEIGQVMGKLTIAEFVENDDILAVVRDIGINYAQGYAVGRPTPITHPKS